MKYVAPIYLIVVFVAFCRSQPAELDPGGRATSRLRQGALALIAATTLLLVVCTYVGEKRWRAAGIDVDGRQPAAD